MPVCSGEQGRVAGVSCGWVLEGGGILHEVRPEWGRTKSGEMRKRMDLLSYDIMVLHIFMCDMMVLW